jgi:hypothetical protein
MKETAKGVYSFDVIYGDTGNIFDVIAAHGCCNGYE